MREQPVYLVMVRVRPPRPEDPNVEVQSAWLRRVDADRVAASVPGSWVDKVVASKGSALRLARAAGA